MENRKMVVLVNPPSGDAMAIMGSVVEYLQKHGIAFICSPSETFVLDEAIRNCLQAEGVKQVSVIFADLLDGQMAEIAKAASREYPGVTLWALAAGKPAGSKKFSVNYFYNVLPDGRRLADFLDVLSLQLKVG